MKLPIKKELKWIFRLAIAIGIVAYLSKFAKKAAPVFACGLIIAMPLAGIGGVNVASAQEDNSIQYPAIDLPDTPKNVEDNYTLKAYVEIKDVRIPSSYSREEGGERRWQDLLEGKEEWKKYCWLRKENVDKSMVKIAENDISYYKTLAKLLQKQKEERCDLNSPSCPLHNSETFDRYLNSIQRDAKRAAKTGAESLIPSPEGMTLDKLTEGIYGKASEINTIAEIGWYIQNISQNSARMLEEVRKNPEKASKVSKSMEYNFDRRIDEVMFDFQAYYLINQGFEPIDTPVGLVKSFDEDVLEVQNSMKGYHLAWYSESWGLYYGFSALGQKEIVYKDYARHRIKNWVLDTYLDKYGYSLPEELDFVRVPITEEEKQDIIEIKKIVDANKEIVKTLPKNKYSKELEKTLNKADHWYNYIAFKPNTVIVSSVMGEKIKKYNPEEFKAYVDHFKEGAIDYPEILGKTNDMKEVMDEDYGVLTKLVFNGDYERQKAELDKVEETLNNFEPEEANEIIVSVENDLVDVKENQGYKVLRFIELTPDHISNIRHTLFPTEEDKLGRLKEKYGEDIEIGVIYNGVEEKYKGKRCIDIGGFNGTAYQNFYGKEFYLDDGVAERIVVYGENGTIYCDRNDVVTEGYNWGDSPEGDVKIPKIESKIIRKWR